MLVTSEFKFVARIKKVTATGVKKGLKSLYFDAPIGRNFSYDKKHHLIVFWPTFYRPYDELADLVCHMRSLFFFVTNLKLPLTNKMQASTVAHLEDHEQNVIFICFIPNAIHKTFLSIRTFCATLYVHAKIQLKNYSSVHNESYFYVPIFLNSSLRLS